MTMSKRSWAVAGLLAVCLTVALALGGLGGAPAVSSAAQPTLEPARGRADMAELRRLADNLSLLFHHTAETVSPAVVWISTTRTIRVRTPGFFFQPFFEDPFFREFFGPGSPWGNAPRGPREREYKQRGLGSGFIFDERGYILTNNHVVSGADEVEVKLADKSTYKAKIVGTDPATELAVIKLVGDVGELPVVKLGDSDELSVGEWVLAIGNPMGLARTVSAGIVSAKGRSIGIARYENLIQTDAAINPGNSGGPLVNLRGEVVGINTAILSGGGGGNIGIGFAIPINMAKSILGDLMAGRKVERGGLGILGKDLTPALARQFEFEGTEGALVDEVIQGSPADRAGMKPGDIITRWGQRRIRDYNELREAVAATKPGTTVRVRVWRDGEFRTLKVEVGRLSEIETAQSARNWTGLRVAPVDQSTADYFGMERLEGVVIKEVEPGSPAQDAIEPGDVILSVQRKKVRSVADFNRLIATTSAEEGVLLRVLSRRTRHAGWIYIRG